MKKKKLKKKIKKMEKDIQCLKDSHFRMWNELHGKLQHYEHINKDVVKHNEEIRYMNEDLKILKEWFDRSGVDYSNWFKTEKTCDTCKWKPLMEQGGQDIPCMGCTADDKKMWKPKGENNGN